jgi:predicted permease
MQESWIGGIKRAFALAIRRLSVVHRDADDELSSLIEERTDLLVERGMSREDARAEAMRLLGKPLEEASADLRRSAERRERVMSIRERLDEAAADVRYAIRGLRREVLFSSFIVVTLALAIGVNAAMFGIVDRVLLRGPAHVVAPDRLVRVYWSVRGPAGEDRTSAAIDPHIYANLALESKAFSGIAMYGRASSFTVLGNGASARLISSASATSNFLSVLGTRVIAGRFFVPEEQDMNAPASVVLIGYGLWRREFGGDPKAVGRSIILDGRPLTIVGIAPEGFTGVELERVDVWTPMLLRSGPAATHWGKGSSSGQSIVARLKPGVTAEEASKDATDAYRRTYDGGNKNLAEANLFGGPLTAGLNGTESVETRVSRWLVGLSAIVLLAACANIVNLLLARSVRRRREMAVRLALGAGRARLLRLLLTSSMTISIIGSLAGLAVAAIAGKLVRYVLLPDVDWTTGPVDARVLAYATLTTIITGIVIGVLPALKASRVDVSSALKAGAREGGGNRSFVRSGLVAGQAVLAMILLVGAGLFARSLDRIRHLDLGVQTDRVVVLEPRWTRLPAGTSDSIRKLEAARRASFVTDIVDRLRATPGVENAAVTVGMPFGGTYAVSLFLPGRDSLPRLRGGFGDPELSAVSREYFATVGTRLLHGRLFTTDDGSSRVALVNETMAKTLWPGREPIGECLLIGKRDAACTRVIGIVQNARRSRLREDPAMHYYVPMGQEPYLTGPDLVVRPRGDAHASIRLLRDALLRIDPTIRYVGTTVLQDRVEPQTRAWRIGAIMFSLFAALALVVAAVGTFSVVAYLVEQRNHEIGVRLALGARAANLIALMMRGPIALSAIGAFGGAAIALVAGRVVESLLFDTSPQDPAVIGGVAALLIGVSVVASTLPALRVRRVDPMEALRDE